MEIGLDYMQMRDRAQHAGLRWAGILMVAGGFLIAAMGIGYYGNLYWLYRGLDDLPAARADAALLADAVAPAPENGRIVSARALKPGVADGELARQGFIPMPQAAAWPLDSQPPAERLSAPKLGIDIKRQRLTGIGDLKESYAARANPAALAAVSARPGERGAVWFFGRQGQGADSFGGLTRAPDLIGRNEAVLIFVGNGEADYAYLATHTDVVASADFRPSYSGRSTIHLAAPVPAGFNDHFLVVSGELVGVKMK